MKQEILVGQIPDFIDQVKNPEYLRKLKILNKAHREALQTSDLESMFPEDFPEAYMKAFSHAAVIAMERYKLDNTPILQKRLDDQQQYIFLLESRKGQYMPSQFEIVFESAVGVFKMIQAQIKALE